VFDKEVTDDDASEGLVAMSATLFSFTVVTSIAVVFGFFGTVTPGIIAFSLREIGLIVVAAFTFLLF
jgi:hypothetical protein